MSLKCNMGCRQGKTRHYGKKLLFIGPPESGKTTALYYLKLNKLVKTIPTPDYNVETIHSENNSFEAIDIGGCVGDRRIFLHFMENAGMVMLFVDSTGDEKRLKVALNRLEIVLAELPLRFAPVAIVASKQDLEPGLTCEMMTAYIQTKPFMQHRYWQVFPISVYGGGTGFILMFKWVDKFYGRINEKSPEYQELMRFNMEQEKIRKQQEEGYRITSRELEKIRFKKNKENKAKMKSKLRHMKRMNKIRIDASG